MASRDTRLSKSPDDPVALSAAGDAYDLSVEFGRDFSRLLRIQNFEIRTADVLDFIPSKADIAYAVERRA